MSDWQLFEDEVRQLVEAFGYRAEATQPSHDYGVDVIAMHSERKVIVQCKLYSRKVVGGQTILQLGGSRQYYEAIDAICVTTTRFTKQAQEIAERLNIHLIDQELLIALCRKRNITIPSLTYLATPDMSLIPIPDSSIIVGRDVKNDVVLPQLNVSRAHARIERAGQRLVLYDQDSTNGTFLNEKRIKAEAVLNYGDIVRIGSTTFEVRMLVV